MPLARGIFFMYKVQDYFGELDTIKKQPLRCFLKVSLNTFYAFFRKGKGGIKYG